MDTSELQPQHKDIGHDDSEQGLVAGSDHSRILEKGLSLGHSDGDASEGGRTEVDHRHVTGGNSGSSGAASRSPSAPREVVGGGGVTASLPPPTFIYDRHILLPPYLIAEGHVPKMFSTNLAERYAVAYLRPYVRRKTAHGSADQTVGRAIYVDGQREVLALVDPTSGVLKREIPIGAIFGVMIEGKLGERGAAETETMAIILAPKKSLSSPMAAASPPRTPRDLAGTPHDPRRPSHLPEVEEASPERLQGNDFNVMLRFDPFPAPQAARAKSTTTSMGSQRDHLEALIATLKHFNPKIQVSQGKPPGTLQKLAPSLNLVKPKDYAKKEVVPDYLKNPPTESEREAPEFDTPDDMAPDEVDGGIPGDDEEGGGASGVGDDSGYNDDDDANHHGNGGDNGGEDSDLEALERNLGGGGLDDNGVAVSPPFNPAAPNNLLNLSDSPYGSIPYAESEGDVSEYTADARRRSSVSLPLMLPVAIVPKAPVVVMDPLRSETQWAAHERTQLMDTWRALQSKRQIGGAGGVPPTGKVGNVATPTPPSITEEVQHAHTYFTADEDPARQGFVLGHLPACLTRPTPKEAKKNTMDGAEEDIDVDTDVEDPMDPDVRAKELADEIARTPDTTTAEDPSVSSSFLQRRLHSLLTTPSVCDTAMGRLFQSTLSTATATKGDDDDGAVGSGGAAALHGYYPHNPMRLLESWDGTRKKDDGGDEEEDDIVQALGRFREILSSSDEKRRLLDSHSRPPILNSVFFGLPYPGSVATEEVEAMREHVAGLIYASPLNNNIDEELYGAQQQLLGILLQAPSSPAADSVTDMSSQPQQNDGDLSAPPAPVELVEDEEEQTIARLSTASTTPVPDLFPPLLDLPALIRTIENGSALDRKGFLQWRDRISKAAAHDARNYLDDDVEAPEYTPPAEGEDSLLTLPGGFLEWAHLQQVSRLASSGGGRRGAGGDTSGNIHTTTSSMRPTKSGTSNHNSAPSLATLAANAQQFTAADDVVLQSSIEEDSYAAIWRGAVVQRLYRFINTHLSKEVSWQLGIPGIQSRIEGEISPLLALTWPAHIRVCDRKASSVRLDPSNPISHSELLYNTCMDAWVRRADRHMNDSVYDTVSAGVSYRRLGCGGGDVDAVAWWRSLLGAVSSTLSESSPYSTNFSPSLYRYNICQYEISRAEIEEGRDIMADLKQRIRNVDTLVLEARAAARSTDHLQGAGATAVNSAVPSLHQIVAGSRDTAPQNRTRASAAAEDRRVAHPDYNREINLATLIFNICELQRQRLAML